MHIWWINMHGRMFGMDMREQLYMLAIEEHGGIRGGSGDSAYFSACAQYLPEQFREQKRHSFI